MLSFVPSYQGVPYDRKFSGALQINTRTGQTLSYASPPKAPAPPDSVVPAINAAQARLTAFRHLLERREGVFRESAEYPLHLALVAPPKREDLPKVLTYLDEEERRLAREGKAALVYTVQIQDISSNYPGSDQPFHVYNLYVNAKTGKVMVMEWPVGRGGGGSGKSADVSALRPSRVWRVGSELVTGALRPTSPAHAPDDAATVDLEADGIVVRVLVDVAASRFWIKLPGGDVALDPTGSLAAALRRQAKEAAVEPV